MMSMPDPKVRSCGSTCTTRTSCRAHACSTWCCVTAQRRRGNATVLSWFDLASDPKEKILRTDHIHPNEKGTVVFADLVSKAVAWWNSNTTSQVTKFSPPWRFVRRLGLSAGQ